LGAFKVGKTSDADFFSKYYSRQMVLKEFGKQGQETLAKSKVAVVGLGGLGTVSSLYLALAGVGHLRLIDQDTVELANLHRQILYTPKDLHYPKAEVSARRLRKANPLVKVEAVPENVNLRNVERLLLGVDCVVDGLDNMQSRYSVNRACAKLRIPYVFGAAIGTEGNLTVFAPPETPCLECVFPNVHDDYVQTCDTRGVLGTTPGIIGTMQAMETVKLLTKMGTPLKGKLMICDFSDMYFTTIDILKRKGCPSCQAEVHLPIGTERLVWLCGENTVNINPEKPWTLNLQEAYKLINLHFKVRARSHLAIIFVSKGSELTLFKGGRVLIRDVKDETSALKLYKEVKKKLKQI
jgi:molybdopterin/thiamine biosynthesis adenylyltransferase